MTRFEVDSVIIPLYVNSAQVFLQLSIGALGLSIVFREKVLGEEKPISMEILLVSSWLCYLLAIGASAFYQYLAIEFLDSISDHPANTKYYFEFLIYLIHTPGQVYGTMLVFFFLGSVLLVMSSAKQLFRKHGP